MYKYELLKVRYRVEEERTYTPDFVILTRSKKRIVVETKGYWDTADRMKLKRVVEQHPNLDLRIVFQRANKTITKRSRTTYAEWCDKHLGIPWAEGDVPDAWLEE